MSAEEKHKEGAFVVREFRAEDVAAASEILQEAREAASWSGKALLEFMPLPGAVALMSERAGRPTGFVLGRLVADEAEVLNLAVREECRRQGEGRTLLEELLRRFAESGVSRVFLEVRESNRGAIGFYERMGFRQSGRREDYYREPQEAALVYKKTNNLPGWYRKPLDVEFHGASLRTCSIHTPFMRRNAWPARSGALGT